MINELDKNTVYKIIFSYFKDKNKTEFIVENLFIKHRNFNIKQGLIDSYLEIPIIIKNKEIGYKYQTVFDLSNDEYLLISKEDYLKELKKNNLTYKKFNYRYIPYLKIKIKDIF